MKSAQRKGFTLIELLLVIAIVGVLAAIVLLAINPAKRLAQARDSGRKSDVSQLATAAQAYFTTYSRYPTTLGELTASGDIKQVPSSVAVSGCTPAGVVTSNYGLTYRTSDTAEAAVTACIEEPTSATANSYWVWRSATGTAAEQSTNGAP